jgi:hypothetical protein
MLTLVIKPSHPQPLPLSVLTKPKCHLTDESHCLQFTTLLALYLNISHHQLLQDRFHSLWLEPRASLLALLAVQWQEILETTRYRCLPSSTFTLVRHQAAGHTLETNLYQKTLQDLPGQKCFADQECLDR